MNVQRTAFAANTGLTLMEVLVVIAVLSLIAALATPLLNRPPSRVQLKADATRMAAALRVTRAAAMAENRDMLFLIDAARRTYASPVIGASRIDPRTSIDMAVSESERQSAIVGGIRFLPSGGSTGGDIRLRLSPAEARVRVIWATGHVVLDQ